MQFIRTGSESYSVTGLDGKCILRQYSVQSYNVAFAYNTGSIGSGSNCNSLAPIQITGHHELSVGRIRGNNVAGITILAFKVYCKELVSCQ